MIEQSKIDRLDGFVVAFLEKWVPADRRAEAAIELAEIVEECSHVASLLALRCVLKEPTP